MVRPRLVRAKRSTAIDTFRLEPRAALVARPPEASAGEANSEAATTPAATAASHNRHCWRIYLPPSLDGPRPCARRGSTQFEGERTPPPACQPSARGGRPTAPAWSLPRRPHGMRRHDQLVRVVLRLDVAEAPVRVARKHLVSPGVALDEVVVVELGAPGRKGLLDHSH